MLCCKTLTKIEVKNGWTTKPTPTSDTARLRRNVFKVLDNKEVFLIAEMVIMFNTMVVQERILLNTQHIMLVERRLSTSDICSKS